MCDGCKDGIRYSPAKMFNLTESRTKEFTKIVNGLVSTTERISELFELLQKQAKNEDEKRFMCYMFGRVVERNEINTKIVNLEKEMEQKLGSV